MVGRLVTDDRPLKAGRRELLTTWAICVGVLAVTKGFSALDPTGLVAGNMAGVAALLFILLPERAFERSGGNWGECGFPWWGLRDERTWRAWGRGLVDALRVCAVVFPLFLIVFWGYQRALPHVPPGLASIITPYVEPTMPRLRLPDGFALMIPVQLFVVALPEELFYRGWMQSAWAGTAPGRKTRILGADLRAGFVATQVLFALGHLVILQPWRLGTFFPGLLFGWLREKTGGLVAPILVHASSNLFIKVLEASFYG